MSQADNESANKDPHDGIHELDNDLPNWWLLIFLVTIVYSIMYMFYYHADGGGLSPTQEYLVEQKKLVEESSEITSNGGFSISEEDLAASLNSEEQIKKGHQIYSSKCVACHAPDGAGSVGPNLTDDYWLHGGSPAQIAKSILEGIPEKGMIAWETLLQKNEVLSLVAYIKSLKGLNPANAKAPQGEKEEM